MKRRRHNRSTRRGAVMAEMAIVTPLLLTILVGVIEFGWVFAVRQELVAMTRDAARFATHRTLTATYVEDEVKPRLAAQLQRYKIPDDSITVEYPDGAEKIEDVPVEDRLVTVRIRVPYGLITLLGKPIFGVGGGIGFTVSSTMRIMR